MRDACPSVEQAIRARLAKGGKALVPFLTAGFPSRSRFVEALRRIAESGCDVVEVGLPFSDPLADGPVIQRASKRSLDRGMTIQLALELIHRAEVSTPIVLMGYLNPLLAHGWRRLTRDARSVGIRGFVVPDLPWTPPCRLKPVAADAPPPRPCDTAEILRMAGFDVVLLAAPTTSAGRLRRIGAQTRGFLYAVTMAGVTGVRNRTPLETAQFLARARGATRMPVLAGFGIDGAATAARIAVHCDGVIIGSALLEILQRGPDSSAVSRLGRFLDKVRNVLSKGV